MPKLLKEIFGAGNHPIVQDLANKESMDRTSGYQINKTMTTHGVSVLGGGIGGVAIKHKSHVYKIYHPSSDDYGYHSFVDYARHNQDDPHLPKIHATGTVKGTGFKAVKMEHLHPINEFHNDYNLLFEKNPKGGYSTPKFYGKGQNVHDDLQNTEKGRALKRANPSLHASLSRMALVHSEHGMDLHEGNFMVRRDHTKQGTTVITDPSVGILSHG